MTRASFFQRGYSFCCYSCWFFKSLTRPLATIAIFLIICLGVLSRSQTLAHDIEVFAELELKAGTRDGLLTITTNIPGGCHIYSLTQPVGGPTRSTSKLNGTGIQLTSAFIAQQEPVVKHIDADTPEQIAAMAELYDVDEPIKYIDSTEMSQFPVGPVNSEPIKQVPLLLALLVAFISGAIISLMVYMLFNRSIETKKTEQQDDRKPVYPRMRRIAFIACMLFSICIVAVGGLMVAKTLPWTHNDETQPTAAAEPPTITWANWHPGKVVQQLNQNKIVWVNYTADWDPTSKLNEARVASNRELVQRMNKMNISFVTVDFTLKDDSNWKELARTDTYSTPVNFIYPPNYPQEPAIKLETLFSPTDVHRVLDRMEAIIFKLNK